MMKFFGKTGSGWQIPWALDWRQAGSLALLTAAIALFGAVIYQIPLPWDWEFFYRAAQNPGNPYTVEGFYNPPWLVWILAPFGMMPKHLAFVLWMLATTFVIIGSIRAFGGNLASVMLVLLSPAFLRYAMSGQIDAVPLAGFALLSLKGRPMAQGIGGALMAVKPQTLGLGFAAHWITLERRDKARVLLVPAGVLGLSFLVYGWWPAQIDLSTVNRLSNFSIWPYGAPVGLGLFVWAAQRKRVDVAALSTYFLVPYLGPYTLVAYLAVLFSIIPIWAAIVVEIALWAVALSTL